MIQKVIFTEAECNFLKSFLKRDDIIKAPKDARGSFNTTVLVIPPEEVPDWFLKKIKTFGIKDIKFNNQFAASRSVILTFYETHGYFSRHKDNYARETHWGKRYKSLVVQLSNPNSYEGGDLLIDDVVVDKTIGNVVYFDSSTYHELTTITKGNRYSLILWLDRDDVIDSKSLL